MIKVLAIGNTLMTDDGVAVYVVRELTKRAINNESHIEYIIAETEAMYAYNQISDQDIIILVDAIIQDEEIGYIKVYNLEDISKNTFSNKTNHDSDVLHLCRLYNKNIKGYLIGIKVEEINFGLGLSNELTKKFIDLCNEIEKIIKAISEGFVNA